MMTKDDLVSKDTALKVAIDALLYGTDHTKAVKACKEALDTEQVREDLPAQEPVGWNEEEFNEIAYAYRICPAHKVNMVSERYQDLVAYVLSLKDKNT